VAYIFVGSGALRQTLAETYQAHTDYSLSATLAVDKPEALNHKLDLVFYAGMDESAEISRTSIDFTDAAVRAFKRHTARATAEQIAAAGATGKPIRIAFESLLERELRGEFDIDAVAVRMEERPVRNRAGARLRARHVAVRMEERPVRN
jgi:hypothetical protein